jgi:hypothetical protein
MNDLLDMQGSTIHAVAEPKRSSKCQVVFADELS